MVIAMTFTGTPLMHAYCHRCRGTQLYHSLKPGWHLLGSASCSWTLLHLLPSLLAPFASIGCSFVTSHPNPFLSPPHNRTSVQNHPCLPLTCRRSRAEGSHMVMSPGVISPAQMSPTSTPGPEGLMPCFHFCFSAPL
jgi:hypothetical protein